MVDGRACDVGGDLLHGVEAEVAAVGEDRGQQRADLAGVDPLARLLEVDAEPEVVLDLDEQVGQPDRAVARVQPAVQLGEAVRLRRVGRLGRVRLEPPPIVVERDLPVVSDTFQEAVERIRQASFQLLDRRVGIDGESGPRPERVADLLPLRGGQEEGLEPAEVLRALDGEVAGLDRSGLRPPTCLPSLLIAGKILPLRASKSIWRARSKGDEMAQNGGLRPSPYSVFLHESGLV